MKFPTYKELDEIAAKEALDTFEYKGKTLREWIEIISAAELGTNLAEVGTDLVSRQQAIEPEVISKWKKEFREYVDSLDIARDDWKGIIEYIDELPSIQPKGTRLSTVCLLCKKPAVTFNTEDDIPYTNYSYCEDCLRKGLKLLREQKKNSQAQPERKTGHWILDRSGAYCCSKCMEPCATYAMMKPRDKFCKMCGSRNEVKNGKDD